MSTILYLKRLFITLVAALGMAMGGIAMAYDGQDDKERPGQPHPVMEQPAGQPGYGDQDDDRDDTTGDDGW